MPIEVPPRRRPGDVGLLAMHFLVDLNRDAREPRALAESALARLEQHSWPGNVRELRNASDD